jgi:hypothetical protein
MQVAKTIVVIDTQNDPAMREFTHPAFTRNLDLLHVRSFPLMMKVPITTANYGYASKKK